MPSIRNLSCGKTCRESSRSGTTPSGVSLPRWLAARPPSFRHRDKNGPALVWLLDRKDKSLGEQLTRNFSESPSDGGVCTSLPDVLEDGPIQPKYFLSRKACAGILSRAKKRKRNLPPVLELALKRQKARNIRFTKPVAGDMVVLDTLVSGAVTTKCGVRGGGLDVPGSMPVVGIAHTLRGEGFDASEDGTGRGRPMIVFHPTQDPVTSAKRCHALGCGGRSGQASAALAYAVRVANRSSNGWGVDSKVAYTLDRSGPSAVAVPLPAKWTWVVRYLTPRECERLQGIPDDYTLIPWRKGLAADSPRYKAVGNGMAIPCVIWVLKRIDKAKRKR